MIGNSKLLTSGKKLRNVAKSGLELDKVTDEMKEQFKPLTEWWKKLMPEQLDSVVLSERLTTSPCAIVAHEYAWSANMQKLMKV